MISPRHFITASHIGAAAVTFEHKAFFSGEGADRIYYLNPNANGGLGHWNMPGTDLRVFEVYGDFPDYAPLYTGTDEAGKETVMMGRGLTRGAEVTLQTQTRGWKWGANDKRARWGVNEVDSIESDDSVGDLLVTDFDEAPGSEECHAASGDSGGALFVKDGARWKLAGIMYAVDGKYDTNTTCADGSEFHAAMFNALGFFIGEDNTECDGWEAVSMSNDTVRSRTYASRISSSAAAIRAIIRGALDDGAKSNLERYEDWIAGFGLAAGTLAGEDADGDLEPNLVEYLSALDPGAVDVPKRTFEVAEAGEKLRFTVRVRLDAVARGLSWEIRQADDLAAAAFLPVTGLSQTGLSRLLAVGVEIFEFDIDRPSGLRRFYRLEVAMAP
jgi:hypothetical protein